MNIYLYIYMINMNTTANEGIWIVTQKSHIPHAS